MNHLTRPATSLLLGASQLLLSILTSLCTGLVSYSPAQAQSPEVVARIAQAITVRIEGATQGSGVLIRRQGNRYTILTAWHVVRDHVSGEELAIITADGKEHQLETGSISRVGSVDIGVLSFASSNSYSLAGIGDLDRVFSGSSIYISGFPLATSAVPKRIWRFFRGEIVAYSKETIPNGLRLLYSNPTLPGTSGGPILDDKGLLIGIHARAEKADSISNATGKPIATGINQGVPIFYYRQPESSSQKERDRANTPDIHRNHTIPTRDSKTRYSGETLTIPKGRSTRTNIARPLDSVRPIPKEHPDAECLLRRSLGYRC